MKNLNILFYQTPSDQAQIEVFFEDETFWLTQKKMAALFGVETQTINYHLKEIFKSGELKENSVIRNFRITAADGKPYNTKHYNLDAIISVGYRVNSKQATQFRIWATKSFLGYTLVDYKCWERKLENFLRANKFSFLQDANFESDFDQSIKKLKK